MPATVENPAVITACSSDGVMSRRYGRISIVLSVEAKNTLAAEAVDSPAVVPTVI